MDEEKNLRPNTDTTFREAILEDGVYNAHRDFKALSDGMGKRGFDPSTVPPVHESLLKEAIYTIALNPRYSGGNWSIQDVLMRMVTYGLILEDMQLEGKPLPAPFIPQPVPGETR